MTFLLLLVVFIIALPYIGRLLNRLIIWLFTRQIKRQTRRAYEQAFGGTGNDNYTRRSAEPSSPEPRGKRIDPSVGEYVEYEEIEGAAAAVMSDGTTVETFVAESQITDVEWEEIQ